MGKVDNPDAKATEGSPACGDMVSLYLKIDEKEKRITDIRFESYGCASNIATGSIITDMAKGKTLQEAKKITWKMASEKLGGLHPGKPFHHAYLGPERPCPHPQGPLQAPAASELSGGLRDVCIHDTIPSRLDRRCGGNGNPAACVPQADTS